MLLIIVYSYSVLSTLTSSQGSENRLARAAVLPSLYRHVFLVRVLDPAMYFFLYYWGIPLCAIDS